MNALISLNHGIPDKIVYKSTINLGTYLILEQYIDQDTLFLMG
jgi:hypothetical protein